MKKKLVFVTARLPFPASSGRKNVMYNYCKILNESYGYDITVVSFLENGDVAKCKPSFIREVVVLPAVDGKRKIYNLLKYTVFLRKFPMQVSLFYDPQIKNRIYEVIDRVKPDVVMSDMVRTTEYTKGFKGYKIADLDDRLSLRYERQLSMDLTNINPYGAYLFSLPKIIQKMLSLSIIKRIVLYSEVNLLKRYEREIALQHDKTIFVAEREATILNNELSMDKAVCVPLGVDIDYFGEYFNSLETDKHAIAFLGAMSVAHNEAGALHFIRDIFPLIQKKYPDAKFYIVGGGVTEVVKEAAKGNSGIIFTGKVDDVRLYVGKCSVFVCPLTFGSGIKTKNLEAMAMGVPVVTTSIGAENINAKDGYEWIIADDDIQFANAIVELFEDDGRMLTLKNNAYKFVEKYFTWKVAEERFKQFV